MNNPFRCFNSSPEVIRLAVMLYIRYLLSLRQVEDILFERGIDICHETIRYWWNRFGPMFAAEIRKKHTVPLFPAAGDGSGRQGFLRVVNRSETAGRVRITAFDETDRDYEPLMLSIGANEVVHFNSDDLEQGNAQKGLTAGTYQIEGDTLLGSGATWPYPRKEPS